MVTTSLESVSGVEWSILLECVRPKADARRLTGLLRASVDWPSVFALAEQHAILAQLAAGLANVDAELIPQELKQRLAEWNRRHSIFTLSLLAELFQLTERFAALEIKFLATKGPVLAQRCYGDAGGRQYSDLDLVVRHRDIRRASEAMSELGYRPRVPLDAIAADKIPGEYVFRNSRTNALVEFHTERTFRYHPRPLQVDKIFERSTRLRIGDREVPALSLEDELILICIHSAKHLWEQLSWVADVAALISSSPALEWDRVMAGARKVGAERMLGLGLRLASDMLDVSLPAEVAADVRRDSGGSRLAAQLADRMPRAGSAQLGILQRALFRVRMRGSFLNGVPYLLRLSFSPTEEDWRSVSEEERPRLFEALGRPFRLLRKYGAKPEMERARMAKSEPG